MRRYLKLNTPVWNKVYFIYYYCIVAVVAFFLMRPNLPIGTVVRIVFFVAIFFPIVFRIRLFLPVFFFFVTVSTHSFMPFLPTQWIIYFVLVVVMCPFAKNKRYELYLLPILLFFVLNDMLHSNLATWSYWIFTVALLSVWISEDRDIEQLVLVIMLASVFLALLYIFNFSAFESVKHTSDDEYYSTSGWMNHNRFDAALGCGALLGVATLLNVFHGLKSKKDKIIAIASIVLTLVVMLMDVSRGAIISLAGGTVVLLVLSKTSVKIKTAIVAALLLFVVVSMFMGYTDYLQSRFSDTTMSRAGGRTDIWKGKFQYLFEEGDLSTYLFGMGRENCNALANGRSTHNDWLTAFIGFGVIGVIVYSMFYVIPLLKIKHINSLFLAVMMFLLLESLVLEPFFRGNPQMVMLYFVGIKYAQIAEHKRKAKETVVVCETVNMRTQENQYMAH